MRSLVLGDVESIIRDGAFFRARFTTELERALAHRFGGRAATCVGNGTDALYLALAAVEIGTGDRVATVANAGGYSTNAILRCGAHPTFIDIDPVTAQMSSGGLSDALANDRSIRAVVATHLYGLVGEISAIREACNDASVWLIEDCAQSFGAEVNGVPAGTFGQLATCSFYPTKNLGAFGDAGAVVSSTPELDARVRSLAQYGWQSRYEITVAGGINSRIDEIQAAILLRGMELVDDQNRRRREIALRYHASLTGGRRLIATDDERYVAHLAILITDSRHADAQSLELAGIGTGIHYPIADHRQPAWTGVGDACELVATDFLQPRILTLPCFPTMTDGEVDRVAAALAALPG